jgi:hypothetical protein
MKALQAYVDQKNQWAAIFKGKQMEWQTPQGRQRIADALDCDLSPENLTCDGELGWAQVRAKAQKLNKAAKELKQLDPSVKMYEFA